MRRLWEVKLMCPVIAWSAKKDCLKMTVFLQNTHYLFYNYGISTSEIVMSVVEHIVFLYSNICFLWFIILTVDLSLSYKQEIYNGQFYIKYICINSSLLSNILQNKDNYKVLHT